MKLSKSQRDVLEKMRDGCEMYAYLDDHDLSKAVAADFKNPWGKVNASTATALISRGLIERSTRYGTHGFHYCVPVRCYPMGLTEAGRKALEEQS